MFAWPVWFALWIPLLGNSAQAEQDVHRLTLSSQMVVDQQDLAISEDDWHWLRQKRELVLGVAADVSAPLGIIRRDGSYEGIGADAVALVEQWLGMQVHLRQYPDHPALLRALASGEIDFFVGDGQDGTAFPITRSQAFATDRLALFRRYDDARTLPQDLDGMRVAMVPAHDQFLGPQYAGAQQVATASVEEGLAAVAFGKADLLLGDVLPVYYQLNRSFYGLVKFERFIEQPDVGIAFVLREEDQRLLRSIDAALRAIGRVRLDEVARRWVGSGMTPAAERLPLTAEEQRWIERHPSVRLVFDDDIAPLAFFDEEGQFRGIVADLLETASLRTGLRFEAVSRAGGFARQIDSLLEDEADLAILAASKERETKFRFTRPVSTVPFALVARTDQDADALPVPGKGKGLRLAVGKGNVARAEIQAAYPGLQLVDTGSYVDAMHLVADGRANSALVPVTTARYYITRLFQGRLAIKGLAAIEPVTANFAMRRADTELQAILDKTLTSLPPDELNAISNRWRGSPGMSQQTWRDYGTLIQRIVVGAALLLLLVLAWGFYQGREVRRRRAAERQLNDELRFIETLTDSMPPPLYVRDTEGRLLSCNRSYLTSIGLPLETVRGRTVTELPPEVFESAPEFQQLYLQAMAEGRTLQGVRTVQMGERTLWIDHWVQPFQDSTGAVKGVICGWLDVTEHRQLVQELEAAKNLADEASRAKTTFLATMSHEIRTPMNAVIGILELALKRAGEQPIDRASIEVAYGSARSLLVLIGDILDIARIESGRLSLAPHRANLRELVESVARVFDGLARQKRLNLMLDIDSSIQGDVLVDSMRFKQILSNLVSNAIKFTREGSIRLRIQGNSVEPGMLGVTLSVEDTGIGISEEDQARLFLPFAQVERGYHQTEGAGLGLVICRSLCEMMGGGLTLTSAPGKGTQVEVELRLNRLDPVAEPATNASQREGEKRRLRVLVVDDHPVNRQILAQQLGFLGHEVVEAENGADALACWRLHPFDVVATDCHMPRMSGAELARAIRDEEREREAAPVLILGLTADAQPEEVERSIQAGMDDCLIKPIGLDLLDETLRGASGGDPVAESAATVPAFDAVEAAGLFDLAPLAPLTGGDPNLIRKLVNELLETNRRDLLPLGELAEQGDVAGLCELAHRLKGAARVVRAEPLIAACVNLEQACEVNTPEPAAVLASAGELRLAMLELEQALQARLAAGDQ